MIWKREVYQAVAEKLMSVGSKGRLLFLAVIFCVLPACSNRLSPHVDILVGEPAVSASKPGASEVAITYLGTNGYLIESGGTAIAVDPYFTRTGLHTVTLNGPMQPETERIESSLAVSDFPDSIDAFLITHSHFDHLLDVPPLQKQFGGKVVTSQTGKFLCEASGVDGPKVIAAESGEVFHFGKAKVTVLAAAHDRVFGRVPFPGLITEPLVEPPARPKDWKLGTPLAFLVEMEGKKIYVESGGIKGELPDAVAGGVDLAILGVAVRDSQLRYPAAVKALNPRYVLPSHQDDFFAPLDEGFKFGATANFPRVIASHRAEQLESEMILMDFFHRWILP